MRCFRRKRFRSLRTCAAVFLLLGLALVLVPAPSALAFGDFDIVADVACSSCDGCSDVLFDSCGDACVDICADTGGEAVSGCISHTSARTQLIIWAVILAIIVAIVIAVNVKGNKGSEGEDGKRHISPVTEAGQYKTKVDNYYFNLGYPMTKAGHPEVDRQALTDWARSLFTRMDEAWEAGDIQCLLSDFTMPCWTLFNDQLQLKNMTKQRSHASKPSYFDLGIQCWEATGRREILHVWVKASRCVWTEDLNTGRIVTGSPQKPVHIFYDWTLVRARGRAAAEADDPHCPNCGAEVDAATFARCPFCGSELARTGSAWQISAINALFQTQDLRVLERVVPQ